MLLAAVHLTPAVGVPIALAAWAGLMAYHRRLSRLEVPAPRRRVRRLATATMAVGVAAMLTAMSFADPAVRPGLYVASWSAVLMLLMAIVVLAVVDLFVSSWIIRLEHDEAAMRKGAAVLAALEAEAARRAELIESSPDDVDSSDSASEHRA